MSRCSYLRIKTQLDIQGADRSELAVRGYHHHHHTPSIVKKHVVQNCHFVFINYVRAIVRPKCLYPAT